MKRLLLKNLYKSVGSKRLILSCTQFSINWKSVLGLNYISNNSVLGRNYETIFAPNINTLQDAVFKKTNLKIGLFSATGL